jgi:hypothetical protein
MLIGTAEQLVLPDMFIKNELSSNLSYLFLYLILPPIPSLTYSARHSSKVTSTSVRVGRVYQYPRSIYYGRTFEMSV